jgi:hypothetical protein
MPLPEKILPFNNKSLNDIIGEIWKDVPGFEGSYQASTMGRVKSIDRTIVHPRLGQQFVKGRILRKSVAKNSNIKTGEPTIDLRVTFTIENKQYYFNTRRIIYQTFVDPHLNYQKDGWHVINKDGDGYNNQLENLQSFNNSDKTKRAISRDRVMPFLKTADRSQWKKNNSRSKAIDQYDCQSNFMTQFVSIREASRQTNVQDKAIIQVAKGIYKQWNGFVWKYAT